MSSVSPRAAAIASWRVGGSFLTRRGPYFVFQTSLITAFAARSRRSGIPRKFCAAAIKWCDARGLEWLPCKINGDAEALNPTCELTAQKCGNKTARHSPLVTGPQHLVLSRRGQAGPGTRAVRRLVAPPRPGLQT